MNSPITFPTDIGDCLPIMKSDHMVDKAREYNNFYYADDMRIILEFCIYKTLS